MQIPYSQFRGAKNNEEVSKSNTVTVNFYDASQNLLPVTAPQKPLKIYIPRLPSVLEQSIPINVTNHTTLPNATLIYHIFSRPLVNRTLSVVIKPSSSQVQFQVYVKFGSRPNAITGAWDYFQLVPSTSLGTT